MNKKIILLTFYFGISIMLSKNMFSQKLVELGNSGEQSKPYYRIIFNNKQDTSSNIKDNEFVISIQASDTEFQKICQIVKESNFIGDKLISQGTYYFLINNMGDKRIYQTGFIEPLELVFEKFVQVLINKDDKERLRNVLQQTLWRLGSKVNI